MPSNHSLSRNNFMTMGFVWYSPFSPRNQHTGFIVIKRSFQCNWNTLSSIADSPYPLFFILVTSNPAAHSGLRLMKCCILISHGEFMLLPNTRIFLPFDFPPAISFCCIFQFANSTCIMLPYSQKSLGDSQVCLK